MDDVEGIDPGVTGLVRWLRARGFATTDSGDGVSKFTGLTPIMPACLPSAIVRRTMMTAARCGSPTSTLTVTTPHVALRHLQRSRRTPSKWSTGRSSVEAMAECACALHAALTDVLRVVVPGMIQATYDPHDGSTVVSLYGVDDSMLLPISTTDP